jgi:hypothetical protein
MVAKWGNPKTISSPLEELFKIDAKARLYYDEYLHPSDHTGLDVKQRQQYTMNASVLNALLELKNIRAAARKSRGGNLRGLWKSLINDCTLFNDVLKRLYGYGHNLPSSTKLKARLKDYQLNGYESLIDGRVRNKSAQVVTDSMIRLWADIYSGQRSYKPDYTEVYNKYNAFRAGLIDVVMCDTGELYDPNNPEFKPASRATVYNYQSKWEARAVASSRRNGDRQKHMGQFQPFHKLMQPEYAGSIISVDDRQPPFKNLEGKRMWFYLGIDLGSEAITTWVWGDSKEGIILEFYRQMVRNYVQWGIELPYELEGELSLNASYMDTFLADGRMFQKVRIEANNARGKRIEGYFRQLRYGIEKEREGWIARPHARLDANQLGQEKLTQLPSEQIIDQSLRDIERWNNMPHSKDEGVCRWEYFMGKQLPQSRPYNWPAILSGLGMRTTSTMRAGRITLQGRDRVVGHNGEVALGEKLITIMQQIEGKQVNIYWLDANDGGIIKALVYDQQDRLVCELLGDLAYHRSTVERTPECQRNRELSCAYAATVNAFINKGRREINRVAIIERKQDTKPLSFYISGISKYTPAPTNNTPLPEPYVEELPPSRPSDNETTADRFFNS